MSESSIIKSFDWVSLAAQINYTCRRTGSVRILVLPPRSKVVSVDSRAETRMLEGGLLSVPRSNVSPPSDWLVLNMVESSARWQQQKALPFRPEYHNPWRLSYTQLKLLLSNSSAHGYRVMTFSTWHNNMAIVGFYDLGVRHKRPSLGITTLAEVAWKTSISGNLE